MLEHRGLIYALNLGHCASIGHVGLLHYYFLQKIGTSERLNYLLGIKRTLGSGGPRGPLELL